MRSLLNHWRECGPADTLISDLWPPELGGNAFMSVMFVLIWESPHRKLSQSPEPPLWRSASRLTTYCLLEQPWVSTLLSIFEGEHSSLIWWLTCVHARLLLWLCLILCDPMGCSPPGFSVHETLQASIVEWVAMSFSRGSSRPRGWTWVSYVYLHWQVVLYH